MMKKKELTQIKKKLWFSEDELNELSITSYEQAKHFISQRAYQSLRPLMDNVSWNETLRNKLFNINLFRANNLSHPPFIGLLNPRYGYLFKGGKFTSAKDLSAYLDKSNIKNIAIKHVVGGLGQNVYILSYLGNGKYIRLDKKIINESDIDHFLTHDSDNVKGYVVEEQISLHPDIKKITGGGVSSIRVITLRKKDGNIKIQGAYIRFGVDKALTDHAKNGGVNAKIDLESGKIEKGIIYKKGKSPVWINEHPETKENFVGLKVPHWGLVIDLAKEAAKKTPGIHFIGWDIVVSESAPFLIEGNVGNPMSLYQILLGGFFKKDIASSWESELGCWLPDGTAKWRTYHWNKGRKLSTEDKIKTALQKAFTKHR